jgi:phosphoglycolate phosphatase
MCAYQRLSERNTAPFLHFRRRWDDGAVNSYILWDVDGTLVRNGRDAGNLYHEAVELAAGHPIGARLPNRHGKTDGQILRETLAEHGLHERLHAEASRHLDELSLQRHERGEHRELCPGVHEALAAATAQGWVNSLLTGNSASRSRYKLTGAGVAADSFDWDSSYFGELAPIRSDLTLAARAAHPDETLVIVGDTPRDDDAARVAGIPFIAVATGAFTVAELRETGAIAVLDDLESGLPDLLSALAATLSR